MKIYTKTGDQGTTALFGGLRVSKDHIKVEAYGTVDELNSSLGVVLAALTEDLKSNLLLNTCLEEHLLQIQSTLFSIGSHLATEQGKANLYLPELSTSLLTHLETLIDAMEVELPPLKNFILPSGHLIVAYTHVSRCIARRAERIVVSLNQLEPVAPILLSYLNRLSDFLFVLARYCALHLNVKELIWKS